MSRTIARVVRNGGIVPNGPLQEVAEVEIHLEDEQPDVPPELQEKLAAWQEASIPSIFD